ncbi:RNA recognition motif domain-containing protein [Bacteroidota bacterium]
MNIYVGNLSYEVDENDLTEVFEAYGTVNSSRVITDRNSGRSKGFGFITMEDQEEANHAIKELNGAEYEQRDMVVNEAKPRKESYSR